MATAAFNATATQKVAYDTIYNHRIKAIASVEYTLEDFQAFKRDILKAALKVPIGLADKKSGCAYIILSEAELKEFTGNDNLVQDEIDNPGSEPNISGSDSHATIYRKKRPNKRTT